MKKSKVVIKECNVYKESVIYRKLLEGINLIKPTSSFIKKGDDVLIKPNMIMGAAPEKGVTTHPAVIEAIVRIVLDAGGIPIIGDSPQIDNTIEAAKKIGYDRIAKKYNIKIVDFNQPVNVHFKEGAIFKRFEVDKNVLECNKIINVAKLKAHSQMGVTLTVKNMFGTIVGKEKIRKHLIAKNSDVFAKMLLELYKLTKPCLNIIDGIVGVEGQEVIGKTRKVGVLLMGEDGIAVDRIACEIIKADPTQIPIFKANKELNVGNSELKNIAILGDSINKFKVRNFKIPKLREVDAFKMVPKFIKNIIRDRMTSFPSTIRKKCVKCGLCAKVCPMSAIKVNPVSYPIINRKECIRCYCCIEACRNNAIRIKTPLLANIINDKTVRLFKIAVIMPIDLIRGKEFKGEKK